MQFSPSYAAWTYYNKLDKARQQKLLVSSRVQPPQGRDDYTELILLDAQQNLLSAGLLTKLPPLAASVTEKQEEEAGAPILRLGKSEREWSANPHKRRGLEESNQCPLLTPYKKNEVDAYKLEGVVRTEGDRGV